MGNGDADLVTLRRLAAAQDALDRLAGPAAPPRCQVVRVVDLGHIPTAGGHYYACTPVRVAGAEVEGGAGALAADAGVIYVDVIGGPARVGDYLIARPVPPGRWAAEAPGRGPRGITLGECPCVVPLTLNMTVNNPALNFGLFQPTTLVYGPTPPEYLPLGVGPSVHLSPGSFTDAVTGDSFRYWFTCFLGKYTLGRLFAHSVFGSPFRDLFRYTWPIGLHGNTCAPFHLGFGQVYLGGDPASVVTVDGPP